MFTVCRTYVMITTLHTLSHFNQRISELLVLNKYNFNLDKYLSYGRETARSLILFRLKSSVIRKIMHKIGFLGHPMET